MKEDQPELPNMPPASPVGKAARALMAIRDEIDETIEALTIKEKNCKEKLLSALDELGKDAVIVDGTTFRKVHKDATDEIRVLVKKRKKKDQEGDD